MDGPVTKFGKILIANRGEIAVRIVRTLDRLGIASAIVYCGVDKNSPATKSAREAVEITGKTPVAAYLDGAQIIQAAQRIGVDAIHPGYGFLSENADFARAVAEAGMTFIGPSPDSITLMGDKVRARAFVSKHGFPVAPSAIEDDDPKSFAARARRVGAPLLIKPSAGGGGKGMRIVRDLATLEGEIIRARSEGERYFGDGRLYVERYVERPRHIEVQVLGDAYGNVVHLFERECSVQRRFQKIVEETPSPALDEMQRRSICETAAGIARAAGYKGAGTVEFIYGRGEFFFLEMNTRLQVEHPVTEMVTGLDLVAEQIAVAAGERLRFGQGDIKVEGHAVECRLYAESPSRGFVPTTGKVLVLHWPEGDGIRIDSGIATGSVVTSAFDPMLAKLVVHGRDRNEVLARTAAALDRLVLLGCETNAAFLRRLISDPAFVAGEVHTGLLDDTPALAAEPELIPATLRSVLAAAALATLPVRAAADAVPALHAAIGNWRN